MTKKSFWWDYPKDIFYLYLFLIFTSMYVEYTGWCPCVLRLNYTCVLIFYGATVPCAFIIHGAIIPCTSILRELISVATVIYHVWLMYGSCYFRQKRTPVIIGNPVIQYLPVTPGFWFLLILISIYNIVQNIQQSYTYCEINSNTFKLARPDNHKNCA